MQLNLFGETLEIKATSKKELCRKYGVHRITLNKWLNSISELGDHKKTRIFTPLQVNIIYTKLGNP